MDEGPQYISPARWATFEVEPEGRGDDEQIYLWLKRTAASNLSDWAERKRSRLEEIVAEQSLQLGSFRSDLSSRYGTRARPSRSKPCGARS